MSLLDEDFITIEKNEILSKSKLTKSESHKLFWGFFPVTSMDRISKICIN